VFRYRQADISNALRHRRSPWRLASLQSPQSHHSDRAQALPVLTVHTDADSRSSFPRQPPCAGSRAPRTTPHASDTTSRSPAAACVPGHPIDHGRGSIRPAARRSLNLGACLRRQRRNRLRRAWTKMGASGEDEVCEWLGTAKQRDEADILKNKTGERGSRIAGNGN